MELTTGAILRRIMKTDLSVAAHKLATVILDGIAWTDGYNGLQKGAAAFTLSELAERMGVSRQHLHVLLGELAISLLQLTRDRGRGRGAPWIFRFAGCDDQAPRTQVSTTYDTALYREDSHRNVFFRTIMVDRSGPDVTGHWLELIGRAKATLPCRTSDNRYIWEQFRRFNRQRGHEAVPAGYLLGFMRRWRTDGAASTAPAPCPSALSALQATLQQLIAAAPFGNRHFHENDLKKAIGEERYCKRLEELKQKFNCSAFQAKLALHGAAVANREIIR